MPSLKTLRHQEILFSRIFEELTDVRVRDPERALHVATKRRRRRVLAPDGKLNIIAADHPARRVLRANSDPLAMADREEFLTRLVRILSADAVDGVMATMDVLEELLLVDALMQHKGLPPFLDEKAMIVSLNRGGLNGTRWELDDPLTGPTPAHCHAWKMDGVKMLLRIADDDESCLRTMQHCSESITSANKVKMPFFLEPLPVVRTDAGFAIKKTPEALAQIVGVATALGDSSRYLWIKLPYCENFDRVAQSTTAPILLLGGDSTNTEAMFAEIKNGMSSHHNVRGVMVGRNVLYPKSEDPVDVAATVQDIVHSEYHHGEQRTSE
jgi:DhnA family fructose-bisphosphate aldolase class Ia